MLRLRLLLIAVTIAVAAPAHSGPLTQDRCSGQITEPVVWKQIGNDVLENLLFADGSLWISDSSSSSIKRFGPAGTETTGLPGIPSPGGLAKGPDGRIYAGWASGLANALQRSQTSRVVRFSSSNPAGTLETYASGFNMANGLTFGPNDEIYISNDFDYGLIVIPRATPASWRVLTNVWGPNGLVVDPSGETLYAAITFDQRSPIERIPLANPGAHTTAYRLSFGALSLEPGVHAHPEDAGAPLLGVKGLDDMTRDSSGNLYVVANGTGELLKVNPANGQACLLASGLRNPSSVRIAPDSEAFADGNANTLDFYITEFSGAIKVVRYAA